MGIINMTQSIEHLNKFITANESGIPSKLAAKIISNLGGQSKFLAEHREFPREYTSGGIKGFMSSDDMISFYNTNQDELMELSEHIAAQQEFLSIPSISHDGINEIDLTLDQVAKGLSETRSDHPSVEYLAIAQWTVWSISEYTCTQWYNFCHRNGFYK